MNTGPRASFPEPVSLESGLKRHVGEFFQSAGGVPPIDRFWLQKAEASHLCATGFGEYISAIKTELLKGEGLCFGGLSNFLADLSRSLAIGVGIRGWFKGSFLQSPGCRPACGEHIQRSFCSGKIGMHPEETPHHFGRRCPPAFRSSRREELLILV